MPYRLKIRKRGRQLKIRNPFLRLLADCRRQWGWLSMFILIYFLAGLFKSRIALQFGNMTDAALTEGPEAAFAYVRPLLVLLILELIRGVLTYIVVAQTTERMFFDMKMRIFGKLNRLGTETIEKRLRSGDVVTRVNSDLNSLCEDLAGQYTWFARVFFTAVIAFVSCVMLSWELSLVYFILMPPTLWMINRISRPMKEKQKKALQGISTGMNLAGEALGAAVTVKAYGLEQEMDRRFSECMDLASEQETANERLSAQMLSVRYVGVVLPMALMLFAGVLLVQEGRVTPGTVIAFSSLCGSVRGLLEITNSILKTWRRSLAASERVYEILDLEEERSGGVSQAHEEPGIPVVCAQGLQFSYREDTPVLRGLSIEAAQGESVALVGESGCGKSTVLKLLCRFYGLPSQTEGKLRLWDVPAREWELGALRDRIALVGQDSFLFQDSIRNNVSCGRKDVSDESVIRALKDADIWTFVEALPDGLDTRIGDGGLQLSGGQRQRIAIARAFLKDAPLLILDEPTSALDEEAEREIQKSLDRLSKGRTSIIVTHRLYTLKNVDKIYVLEQGRVAEQGSWETLIQKKGVFYRLLMLQQKGGGAQ